MDESHLSRYFQFDFPVVNEELMSDFRRFNDFGMRKHNSLIITLGLVEIEAKGLAFF